MLHTLAMSPKKIKRCHFHSHPIWEVVLNLEGEGEEIIEGVSYPFGPGTIICVPPNMSHKKESVDGFDDIYFHTDTFPTINGVPVSDSVPLVVNDDSAKSFESLLRLMLNLNIQDLPNKTATILSLYDAALQLLASLLTKKKLDPAVESIQSKLIQGFANPELNLSDILSESGYSKDHIRRKFREEFGMTPGDYLKVLRIEYAKKLLSQKEFLHLSISDISSMCGYYDEHYFSKVFRSETGLSPREHIKNSQTEIPDIRILTRKDFPQT